MREHWLKTLAGNIVVGWIFGIFYVTGLTLLFPFLFFLQLAGPSSPNFLIAAIILITISFFGFLGRYGNLAGTLKTLGRITLIPGLLGIFFSVFGRRIIVSVLEGQQLAQGVLLTLISYVENAVPKVLALTVLYIVLGIFMWWIGSKFERN